MIVRRGQVRDEQGSEGRAAEYGAFECLRYSDAGGLTQYGAYVETLMPGSRSSERHWHEKEDELLYVISGEATVVEDDGAHVLHPGDAACWPAGVALRAVRRMTSGPTPRRPRRMSKRLELNATSLYPLHVFSVINRAGFRTITRARPANVQAHRRFPRDIAHSVSPHPRGGLAGRGASRRKGDGSRFSIHQLLENDSRPPFSREAPRTAAARSDFRHGLLEHIRADMSDLASHAREHATPVHGA
jgi:hypothetical protein